MKFTTVIYIRISSDKQEDNYSNNSQYDFCKRVMDRLKIKSTCVTTEIGSAYTSIPKQLAKICTDKRPQIIVVYDTSRFSRNVTFAKRLLKKIHKRGGYVLVCKSLSGDVITSHENTREFLEEVKVYQQESINLSRRIKDIFSFRKKKGYLTTKDPPFGYRIVEVFESGKLRKKLTTNFQEMRVLREMLKIYFTLKEEGKSDAVIFKKLLLHTESNNKTRDRKNRGEEWTLSSIKKVISKGIEYSKCENCGDTIQESVFCDECCRCWCNVCSGYNGEERFECNVCKIKHLQI